MGAGRSRRLAPALAAGCLLLAACSSPNHPATSSSGGPHLPSGSTSSTAAPPYQSGTTLPAARTTGAMRVYATVPLSIGNGQVASAESPDGAVFVAPLTLAAGAAAPIVWVVDGDGPPAVAETLTAGVGALAADQTNLYVANLADVTAYNRSTGNQSGQWPLPPTATDSSTGENPEAMSASDGAVLVSVNTGNAVSVYRINPQSPAAPQLVVQGLSAAFGPNGSVVYERTDHRLVALSASGATTVGPALADAPNGLGGGVQYVDAVAGGYVWVSEPAGQGVDASFSTFVLTTLHAMGTFTGTANEQIVGTTGGVLALDAPYNTSVCPDANPSSECVVRLSPTGTLSDGSPAGATLQLLGPDPAVIAPDPSNTALELERLS